MRFADRADAGRRLARELAGAGLTDPVVVGLPRGGVAVAFEVAAALRAPLDVAVVRKLGVPGHPELGMGAVGEDGVIVVDERIVRQAGVSAPQLAAVAERERAELERRAGRYRASRPPIPLIGRTVVVVDDGIATGSTARAACRVVRTRGAARVLLAVPVGPPELADEIGTDADEIRCLDVPAGFVAVGQSYRDFAQATDEQVLALLALNRERPATPGREG